MKRNRKRAGGRKTSSDKRRLILIIAAAVCAVAVIAAAVVLTGHKKENVETEVSGTASFDENENEVEIEIQGDNESETASGETSQSEEAVEPDNNRYQADFSDYELQKDQVPQVNQLISQYFQAKVDQDAEALYKLFGKAEDDALETRRQELKDEAVYIEDYQAVTCYTRPGLTEDSYVVYVTYDVKFRRVDTLAPGLMWCYVAKNDDGTYVIRENLTPEEADYVAKQNQTEDVRLLSNQVNERLRSAIESDTLLAGIYKDLKNGAVVSSSEKEEESSDSQVQIMEDISQGEETSGENGETSTEEAQSEETAQETTESTEGEAPETESSSASE